MTSPWDTGRRSNFRFEPLTMTWAEAADVACRRSESWLRSHIAELEGFPRPDPMLRVFSAEAVRTWVRQRFKLPPEPLTAQQRVEEGKKDVEERLLARLKQMDYGKKKRDGGR